MKNGFDMNQCRKTQVTLKTRKGLESNGCSILIKNNNNKTYTKIRHLLRAYKRLRKTLKYVSQTHILR